MWDLDTLRRLNEQAHYRAVERSNAERAKQAAKDEANKSEVAVADQPKVFPLSILSRRLLIGPPSLSYLIDLLENSETATAFLELVRQYLPENEEAIMAEGLDRRVAKFKTYFNPRYFPLIDSFDEDDESIADFLDGIPVDLMGFTYEDFHQFTDFRPGYILLLSLSEIPYDDDEDDEDGNAGGRVPIIETVGDLVGEGLARLIPPDGWGGRYLHQVTDGTKFDGCGHFADWVMRDTGLLLLDTAQSDYEERGFAGEEWDRDTVDTLTDEWPVVCDFNDKLQHIAEVLEDDPAANFRELMALLLDDKDLLPPEVSKDQLLLPLEFSEVKVERR